MKRVAGLNLIIIVLLAGVCAAWAATPPVYVFLHARVSDQINIELSETRLRRVLTLLDRYRKEHPESHISATILVSGAMSQAIANRNGTTGIKDLLQDYVRRGLIEIGYDGTDEPTYRLRPVPDLSNAKTAEERWLARGAATEKFLTERRDPLFGTPDPGAGGLKQMQEIFGEAACITGLTQETGSDSEAVQHVRPYNEKAVLFGLPENNPARIPGYRGGVVGLSRQLSPIPEAPPGLFWQDHMLRTSDVGDPASRVVVGDEGAKALKSVLDKLDRSKTHIIHLEIGSLRMYVQPGAVYPPLKYAYDDPGHSKWPRTGFHDEDDVNYFYAKEDGLIKWLLEDFLPANPGSRFITSADLKQMAAPSAGFSVTVAGLRNSLEDLLKNWGNDTLPPSYIRVEGHYLSLADVFQVMSDALAEWHNTGKLPQSVQVIKVFGPTALPDDPGPNAVEVTVASVATACAGLASRFHDTERAAIPKNSIPSRVTVNGIQVNAAQFVRLMAEALVAAAPEAKLKTKMTYMFSTAVYTYPATRAIEDEGGLWTLKPAPLDAGQALRSER